MQIDDIIEIKDKLNPKLWNDFELKPEIKKALLKISDAFLKFANIEKSTVKDILFVGSNANYNWHNKSDIDLHIVLDYKECKDCYIFKVKECVDYIKKNFNERHDITIDKIPVEVYIQEEDEVLNSVPVFSLKYDKWIKKPNRIKDVDVDKNEVKNKYTKIKKSIENLSDYEKVDELFKKIVKDRKEGLKDGGEFDEDNIVFKMLRSNGLLKKIVEKKNKLLSDKLSLDNK